jgi:hypothetical protein
MRISTNGNALAGSLAATLQATEIQKLISGDLENSIVGSEVLFDPGHQLHYVTRLGRNERCRFSHERYSLRSVRCASLGEAFELTPGRRDQKSLFVPDRPFVSRLICDACDDEERLWRLRASLDLFSLACPACARPRTIRGFDLADRRLAAGLTSAQLNRSLADLGIQEGEVFGIEVADGRTQHFVLVDSEIDARESAGVSLVVAGLGNIGSFLGPHLARMNGVVNVVLCDPDAYEVGQQLGQDIPEKSVGRNKAEVQAERLRAIRPELEVEAFAGPVEHLALGRLKGSIVVSCLDSRVARLHLAARAWRVGSPFVDAAVGGGSSLLVRTNVYIPGPDAACFECAFEAADYEALEQVFPCEAQASRDESGISTADRKPEPRLAAGSPNE